MTLGRVCFFARNKEGFSHPFLEKDVVWFFEKRTRVACFRKEEGWLQLLQLIIAQVLQLVVIYLARGT